MLDELQGFTDVSGPCDTYYSCNSDLLSCRCREKGV